MKARSFLIAAALLPVAVLCPYARSNDVEADVSYIYTAVMGTGTYKINGRRISMFSLPLSYTHREKTEDQAGIEWQMPVVLGYDAVSDHNWIGDILDDDLVTLSVLPGMEYQIPVNETWAIKPFGHIGYGHDFSGNENIYMGVLGVRALGTWYPSDGWEFRWGNAFRLAGEYQGRSHHRTSFGMLETGLDVRRYTPLLLSDRPVNVGVYYHYQYFIPEWDIDELRPRESDIGALHELGVSVGLKKPVTILGVSFSRVRAGYNRGSGVQGWTFGTEFPF
jgi:hypothetical protein